MAQDGKRNKLNNQGFALVFVITIISFIAILGGITMSTALFNVRMRGLNRDADKNFYQLEIALDEIYAQTGRTSSEILKEEYAAVLAGLYQTKLDTNEKANDELKKQYITELADKLHLNQSAVTEADKTENCEHAANLLKQFASSFVKDHLTAQNFTVTVESVTFQKKTAGDGKSTGSDDIYSGVSFNGLCLTYLNPETEIESALTVDLKITVPYVQFISGGNALLDYVLVANKEITMGSVSGRAEEHQFDLNGNIYGNAITINPAAIVSVDAGLMTAANNLTINQGTLAIGKSRETPKPEEENSEEDWTPSNRNKVWATGIELNSQANLLTENTDFYVLDDMTLNKDGNYAALSGGYYGYGNEGMEDKEIKTSNPRYSSAIILNGKKDILDLSGLDSLVLAETNPILFPSGENAPASIEITVDLGKQFQTSFENLKTNLSETERVTGIRETETGSGKMDLLPMGNYVRFGVVNQLKDPIEKDNLIISKENVSLELNGTREGLILSGGDVTITGTGTFNGLIMAAGNIRIKGNGKMTLNADASAYEAMLADENIAQYFYDCGDAPSTVLNNYEDFVTRENWSRSGLERGDEGDD